MKARSCLLFALCASILVSTVCSQTCNDITVGTSIFTPSAANAASVTLTGFFITARSFNVSASQTFSLTFGSALFSSNPTCTATPGTASLTWGATTSTATATVATGVTIIAGTNVSWSCVGATAGPVAADTQDICVYTTKNTLPKCGKLPALGGAVSAVTLTVVSTDLIPNKVTAGLVTIAFTAATAITATSTITITTPFNYFKTAGAASGATGSSITCSDACSTSAPTVGNVEVTNTPAVGTTAGYGTVTVVVASHPTTASAITLKLAAGILTMGTAQAATTDGIKVSTSKDRVSPGAASAAIAGGAVSAASLTLVAADATSGQLNTGLVTIAFKAATAITATSTITITTPYMYFANKDAAAAASGSSITCDPACTASAPTVGNVAVTNTPAVGTTAGYGTVTVVVATNPTTVGSITLTLGIGTLTTGRPTAATTDGVKVSTTQDTISPGGASPSTASPAIAVCPAPVGAPGNSSPSSAPTFVASLATIAACIFGLLAL